MTSFPCPFFKDKDGWIPKEKTGQWIQVDLGQNTAFTGLMIQGNKFNQYYASVTTFSVEFSNTGGSDDWQSMTDASGKVIEVSKLNL